MNELDNLPPSFESESSLSQREDSVYTSSSTHSYNGQKMYPSNELETYSFLQSFPSSANPNQSTHFQQEKQLIHQSESKLVQNSSAPNKSTFRDRISYFQIPGKPPPSSSSVTEVEDNSNDQKLGWSINPTATTSTSLPSPSSSPKKTIGSMTMMTNNDNNNNNRNKQIQQTSRPSRRKPHRSSSSVPMSHSSQSINYHGVNIYQAASQGNLPVCVLLWGMASAKRVNLMVPDEQGNNPMHFAVQAETTEVFGFLLQQTRGFFADNVRLLDCRNQAGETPLLRAAATGHVVVIQALLSESADPFSLDHQGHSVFSILARHGNFWSLLWMMRYVREQFGDRICLDLLSCLDVEGHSCLDWAADCGCPNTLELLIRKGLNPFRIDSNLRSPLFWAVRSKKQQAAMMLVATGLDPFQSDAKGQTPFHLALQTTTTGTFSDLVAGLRIANRIRNRLRGKRSRDTSSVIIQSSSSQDNTITIDDDPIDLLYPSMCCLRHHPTRSGHAFAYCLLVLIVWILSICIPWYGWIACLLFLGYGFRFYERKASVNRKKVEGDRNQLSRFDEFLSCPEKGIGVWMGTGVMMLVYLFSCASIAYDHDSSSSSSSSSYSDVPLSLRLSNPLSLGAISGCQEDPQLFWTCMLWMKLVWIFTNPGIVDSRRIDFEEMTSSLSVLPPDPNLFCRTTMVKKPLRSKFCSHLGFVIARFDHYCVWLNNSIGVGNHRSFVLFLLTQTITVCLLVVLIIRSLVREVIGLVGMCSVLEELFSRRCFFVMSIGIFLLLLLIGLCFLLIDQIVNMGRNLTTNERINGHRYSWITDTEGKFCNKFDRGVLINILEFWQVSNYYVDYYKTFQLPEHCCSTVDNLTSIRLGESSPANVVNDTNDLMNRDVNSSSPSIVINDQSIRQLISARYPSQRANRSDSYSSDSITIGDNNVL